ncbi:MAG: hypothetical protein L6E13_03535 [Firmicutes bacterium]|nr:hypothetical protein [Bacillota bacterium]
MSMQGARRGLLACLVVSILLPVAACLWTPGALAAGEPEILAAEAGWGGEVKLGSWAPVRIRLRGGAEDLTVRAEVWAVGLSTASGSQPVRVPRGSYGTEVALPAGVEKDLTLWVPLTGLWAPGAEELEVRLTAGDRLLASQPLRLPSRRDGSVPMIGVLSREPGLVQAFRGLTLNRQGLPVPVPAAELSPETIPDTGDRLEAFQALVIQGGRAAELTAAQRQAIAQWVKGGGALFLSGGPTLAEDLAALVGDALPLRVEAAATGADLTPLARWAGAGEAPPPTPTPVARLRPEGGAVLAGSPEAPLVWRGRLGLGSVTVVAADLALAPLADWPGRTALVRALLSPVLSLWEEPDQGVHGWAVFAQGRQKGEWLWTLAQLAGFVSPEAIPGWQTVALVLGGFALLAGPLAHGLLARLRRQVWVWAVVPALALATGLGLYVVGVKVQGRDLLVHLVSHITLDGRGGGEQAMAAGFFAPSRDELVVRLPEPLPVRVMELSEPGPQPGVLAAALDPGALQEPPYQVVTGRETTVTSRTGQWQVRSVAVRRGLEGGAGRIAADLRVEGNAVVGTVTNETGWHLEDAAVLLGAEVARLGDLPPGASREVRIPIASQDPFDHGPPITTRMYGRPRQAGGGPAAGGLSPWEPYELPPRDAETGRRVEMLQRLIELTVPGPGSRKLSLTFLAFTRDPVGAEWVAAGVPGRRLHALSLVEQRLTLRLPPGPFRLPPELAVVAMVESSSHEWSVLQGSTGPWVEFDEGYMTFASFPPLPEEARVEVLEVTTALIADAPGAPGSGAAGSGGPPQMPAPEGIFRIYNWETGTWDPLPGGQEVARIEPAGRYLGPGGEVRVQVSAQDGRKVQFEVPEVTFEGRVDG